MYREIYEKQNEETKERLILAFSRIREIPEEAGEGCIPDYFRHTAEFLLLIEKTLELEEEGSLFTKDLEESREWIRRLYRDISEEGYEGSYANPDYAFSVLPREWAGLFSFLSSELHALIPWAYEGRRRNITLYLELYLELYGIFLSADRAEDELKEEPISAVQSFYHDYSELFSEDEVRGKTDPEEDFLMRLLMESDLEDPAYLYRFGSCVGENEEKISAFLNTLSEEQIESMARTFTEGYRIGFEVTGKDLSKKSYASLHYHIGFERMIRRAAEQLRDLGLQCILIREEVNSFQGMGNGDPRGAYGSLNRQYLFDHRNDRGLYLDRAFLERRLETLKSAYEAHEEAAGKVAGPAVLETFGETEFIPAIKEGAWRLTEKQSALNVEFSGRAGQLASKYMKAEERSFTIIAYPLPSIGDRFPEIFRETVRINTLDYRLYREIQQKLIDALDLGKEVRILGKGANETDLTVALWPLRDPEKETLFENCVADVNIPVGEVFTSPRLKGTTGLLHVSEVYLEGLRYLDLRIRFEDGMIREYSCANFDTEEENRRYFSENVLMHHETLPMGEFAIGTNTTAYRMARDFGIADKLPILIAEKTGPHFAVGDTCYKDEEELLTFNPDGKAIVARENEVSMLRKENPEKAYMHCHTDITIPFDELGAITVIRWDGTEEDLIRDGLFVLPGTEKLNDPLKR